MTRLQNAPLPRVNTSSSAHDPHYLHDRPVHHSKENILEEVRRNAARRKFIVVLSMLLGLCFPSLSVGQPTASVSGADSPVIELTAEEKAWLQAHPVLRVGVNPTWKPVEFIDQSGRHQGVTAEYLDWIASRLGVELKVIPHLSWQEVLDKAKAHEIDVVSCVARTPDRAAYLEFTEEYLSLPVVVFTQADVPYVADLTELNGHRVAVIEGYVIQTWLASDYPEIELVPAKSMNQAFQMLGHGRVDACLEAILPAGTSIRELGDTNIKVSGETPYRYNACMGVRKDWAILARILQKSLDAIPEATRSAMYQKWLTVKYEQAFDYSILWKMLAAVVVLVAAFVAWNRILSLQVRRRTRELKTANEELQRSEEQLRVLFEQAADAVCVSDLDGRLVQVNEQACQTTGYTEQELLGLNIIDVDANCATPADLEALFASLSPSRPITVESRHRHKDGTTFPVEITISRLETAVGPRILGIARDITERKRAADELETSKAFLERVMHLSPFAMWISDAQGTVIKTNESLRETLNLTDEQIVGKYNVFTDHNLEEQGLMPEVRAVFEELRTTRFTMKWMSTKAGKVDFQGAPDLVIDVSIFPITDNQGQLANVVCQWLDITERKRAEEALEKRVLALTQPLDDAESITFDDLFNLDDIQRLQDEFARATGVASIITQTDGTPITRPSNFCRLCSEVIRKTEIGSHNCFKSDAVIGRSNPAGPIIQPCLSGGLWDAGAAISVGGKHIANWLIGQVRDETQTEERMREYAKLIGTDEETAVAAFRDVPAMSREQFEHVAQVLFTLANQLSTSAYQNVQQARFITERKRAELERGQLEAQLRQAQKMEAVGQLAGGVAHDFNNILTAILGNVELSIEGVRRVLGTEHSVLRSMEQIELAAQRASTLTRQLLTFSRRDVTQPKVLNLNNILTSLEKMLRRLITEDIALEAMTAPELAMVQIDAGQLEQVIVNLVVNASDAMPNGGMLTLETSNTTLDEDYAATHAEIRPGPYVLLAVSDTGHGMDAATRERIFEPFYTTKSVGKGTGLGLATVHGIVKRANGHIAVYSERDHGTTFKVFLPAIDAAPDGNPLVSKPDTLPRGHETLLLCEDDESVRELIAAALQSGGYTVITAGSGREGIDALRTHAGPIDLLITDVIMPDLNGRVLAERLRAIQPGLPTLFISGYTSSVIAHHGVLAEGIEFLEKPFTRQGLLKKVHAILSKTRTNA